VEIASEDFAAYLFDTAFPPSRSETVEILQCHPRLELNAPYEKLFVGSGESTFINWPGVTDELSVMPNKTVRVQYPV